MKSIKRNRSGGFTLVELVVSVAIIAGLFTVAFFVIQGQRVKTQMSSAIQLAGATVPTALTSIYNDNLHSYSAITANAAGKTLLTAAGVNDTMPWADSWTVTTAGTATGPTSTVGITYPCTNNRNPATCASNLAAALTAINAHDVANGSTSMITSATAGSGAATSVVVVYSAPK